MFKPEISIVIDPMLKTYTLDAAVPVPNGCYFAAGATLGVPAGHVVIPEAEGVTLNIGKRDAPCTEAIEVLRFQLTRIPLSEGKNRVIAFAVVEDEVVGVNSKPLPGLPAAELFSPELAPPSGIRINSVNAYVNAMPPGPPRLIANVNVWAPCSNFEFAFDNRGPFGVTGKTLLVVMSARLPDGVCQKAMYEGPVRYETGLDDAEQYDSIAIAFEGQLYIDPLEIVV